MGQEAFRKRRSIKQMEDDSTITSKSYQRMMNSDGVENNNSSKRFFSFGDKYWKICGPGDDTLCVSKIDLIRSSDHEMQNYVKAVKNAPEKYYTKREKAKSKFTVALMETCENEKADGTK